MFNKNGAVIGTVRTPHSMRGAFNRGNIRSNADTRRVFDGKSWKRVDPQASVTLAWLRSEAIAQPVRPLLRFAD